MEGFHLPHSLFTFTNNFVTLNEADGNVCVGVVRQDSDIYP